jgi:16S rRNA (guanine(966)-N(2))-methyltransferase RsmD
MRILAGSYKGRQLSGGHNKSIRPMTSRNKESIFAILDNFFLDHNVLDLFSGSGSLGLESLSRGAARTTFVDCNKSSIVVLKENINTLNLQSERIKIITGDVLTYLEKEINSYRLIFADPPFLYDKIQKVVDAVFQNNRLDEEGIMVLHHEKTNPIHLNERAYRILKQKKTGRSLITFLARRT